MSPFISILFRAGPPDARGSPGGRRTLLSGVVILAALAALPGTMDAARIADMWESSIGEQALRFLRMGDPGVRAALLGSLLMGVTCGILGSYLVVRRMALFGDAVAHAVLPGVALGFMWTMTRDPVAIFVGASVAGILGALTVHAVTETTHLKQDCALGLVLSGFYAVGIVAFTMVQRSPGGGQSGLEHFLFGQMAALSASDLYLMGAVVALTLAFVGFLYKELLVGSFDRGFARACGFPVRWLHYCFVVLLAFAVVVSLQAAGVVLVSALLIIPPAAAYLLTDRFHRMIFLSVLFGVFSGVAGSFLSYLGGGLPTGPFIVVAAAGVFGGVFVLSPRHGVLPRAWRRRRRERRIQIENTIKALYHVMETDEPGSRPVPLRELASYCNEPLAESEAHARALVRTGYAGWVEPAHPAAFTAERAVVLTDAGRVRAEEVVRNHRLWELYLANEAKYAPDHVHEDAEEVEHFLAPEVVDLLRDQLRDPVADPHGRSIPR